MPHIGIVHAPADGPNSNIERILNRTVMIALNRAGLQGIVYDFNGDLETAENILLKDDISILFDEYGIKVPELIITGKYRIEDDTLAVSYKLFDSAVRKMISSSEIKTEIDFFLDRPITDELQEIISIGKERIEHIVEEREAEVAAAEDAEDERQEKAEEPPAIETETKETGIGASPEQGKKRKPRRVEIETAGTVFIPLGKAAELFNLGVYAQAGILINLMPLRQISLYLGIAAGYLRLFPTEVYKASYTKNTVPTGMALQIKQRFTAITWFLRFTGGVAWRIDPTDGAITQVLSPVLPFLSFGGGIGIPMFRNRVELLINIFGMGLFNFYKDPDFSELQVDAILGPLPGLGISLRL